MIDARKFLLDTINAALSSNLTYKECRVMAIRLLEDPGAIFTVQIRGGRASACVVSKPEGGPIGGFGDALDLKTPQHWLETKS